MSETAESLIRRWRREAANFRIVSDEMYDHGDNEEGNLCAVEATRLDTCAEQLAAALKQAKANV
jgi:hypothetical protein